MASRTIDRKGMKSVMVEETAFRVRSGRTRPSRLILPGSVRPGRGVGRPDRGCWSAPTRCPADRLQLTYRDRLIGRADLPRAATGTSVRLRLSRSEAPWRRHQSPPEVLLTAVEQAAAEANGARIIPSFRESLIVRIPLFSLIPSVFSDSGGRSTYEKPEGAAFPTLTQSESNTRFRRS